MFDIPRRRSRIVRLLVAAGALTLGACGGGDSGGGGGGGGTPPPGLVPDFTLQDVNPASASYPGTVSPRQHLGRVSAWYFGHAT
jgi:hypothetical protein